MNKKSRGNRRPAYKPRGKPGVTTAVKKYVKKVTARTRPEMKNIQSNVVEQALVTTPVSSAMYWLEHLSSLTQGTQRDQRVGNEIYLHGLHAKGSFNNNGSSTVYVRRLVLGYTAGVTAGANPTSAELFDNGSGLGITPTTTGATMALITNKINKAQFKVYFDKVIKLSPSTSTDGTQTKLYNHFQKFGGKKIMFEANTAGINAQNYRIGQLYIIAQADNDAVGGITIEQTENSSVYFTDP